MLFLIALCLGLVLLTILMFYLLSDEGMKLSVSTSVLVSLLVIQEIILSLSQVILIGEHLLITTFFIVVINLHHTAPCLYADMKPQWRLTCRRKGGRVLGRHVGQSQQLIGLHIRKERFIIY
ncbi:cholinergic receptor, nicotinic, beta polypeptide 3a precursor [Silurus meridionalis]|uniref:Uncharacterized protein n=1 Tax=Silurus meridionalis TaxID=175797 RepID=A0A8T0A543_SILME|nr:hypothetical protein HF521_015068 [Silurus meridionalis]KAI5087657.1 cholinergic receptor, nicotinic, beta polypeptide 3a precursor [Silurus meridionalis]